LQPVDILILSNGPGELATWVRPVVSSLRQVLGNDRQAVRLSLVLSPCPHATGQEPEIAQGYPELDRIQAAEHFTSFLLWGQTAENWDWRQHGVIVFLGGDQFFSVILGKRLGYRTVAYAEWKARWPRWIDAFGVMKPEIITHAPARYASKMTVVGDLMAEVRSSVDQPHAQHSIVDRLPVSPPTELIGLMPGSKPAKLAQGVPLMLAIAVALHHDRTQTEFVIPVAPTLKLPVLAQYADPEQNSLLAVFGGISATLETESTTALPYLLTSTGLKIWLQTQTPHYALLNQCQLCLTLVGANTAELGSLGVPMIVLLPTQQFDAMRAWDGLPGVLANLPGVGTGFAKLINWIALQRLGLLAWPNIWAGREIVPERVGRLDPQAIATLALDYLSHPEKLQQMRNLLCQVRGETGAAQKLASIVAEQVSIARSSSI
jgi:lipid A disaccharide synthetase